MYLSGCAKSQLNAATDVTPHSADRVFCLTEQVHDANSVQPFKGDRRLSLKTARNLGLEGYMPLWRWHGRTFARKALFFWTATILSLAQNAPTGASPAPPPKQIRNDLLKSLAQKGAIFSNFGNL